MAPLVVNPPLLTPQLILIYTPRPIQSISRDIHGMLSPPRNPASLWPGNFWLKSVSLLLATFLDHFDDFLRFRFFGGLWVFADKPTVILGKLAGGGSVAVADGISDS